VSLRVIGDQFRALFSLLVCGIGDSSSAARAGAPIRIDRRTSIRIDLCALPLLWSWLQWHINTH